MTKQEALNLLTQVVVQTRATLQEHQLLQEAIKTISVEALNKTPTIPTTETTTKKD